MTYDKYYFTIFDCYDPPMEFSKAPPECTTLKEFLLNRYPHDMGEAEKWYKNIGYTDDTIYTEHIELFRIYTFGWKVCIRRSKGDKNEI